MKYWTCWDLKNIRMLWMVLVYLDEMKSGLMLAWMKEDLPWTTSLFWFVWNHGVSVEPCHETPQYFLGNEARKIHTRGQHRLWWFLLSTTQKIVSQKRFAVDLFCWRCSFQHGLLHGTTPRTQREELDRYDVRPRDQTWEILGADQEARRRSQEGPLILSDLVGRSFIYEWLGPVVTSWNHDWFDSFDSFCFQIARSQDDKEGATGTTIDKTKYQEREKLFFSDLNMTGDDLGTTLPAR